MAYSFQGVKFGDKHSYDDWGLLLTAPPIISPPSVKTNLVEIPGGNGYINMTEALTGEPTYSTREATFSFMKVAPRAEWQEIYTEIANHLHGREMRIITDEDNAHYYTGVCTLGEFSKKDEKSFAISIKATLQPFKYDSEYTVIADVQDLEEETRYLDLHATDNALQDWNTDFYLGTKNSPLGNLTPYTHLSIHWDKNCFFFGNTVRINISDGDGGVDNFSFQRTEKEGYFDIAKKDFDNVYPPEIYRVLITNIGGAQIFGKANGRFVQLDGCACSVPIILNSTNDSGRISANGYYKDYTDGYQVFDDIKVKPTGTEICINKRSSTSTGTLDLMYRKAWL